MPSVSGAESDEDSGSETDGEGFGETHEFITMENNFTKTTANTTTMTTTAAIPNPYPERISNLGTEDSERSEKNTYESSTGFESHETAAIGSKGVITHQTGCKYSEYSGPGLIQCDCAGTEIIARQKAQAPATADTAALYAQLQAIMNQIYSETGQVVVPRLNTSVACEIVETGKEEVIVEVDVRVTHRSSRVLEHVGVCSQARQVLGTRESCPILESMVEGRS